MWCGNYNFWNWLFFSVQNANKTSTVNQSFGKAFQMFLGNLKFLHKNMHTICLVMNNNNERHLQREWWQCFISIFWNPTVFYPFTIHKHNPIILLFESSHVVSMATRRLQSTQSIAKNVAKDVTRYKVQTSTKFGARTSYVAMLKAMIQEGLWADC